MNCGKANIALHSGDALAPEERKFMRMQSACLPRLLHKACTSYGHTTVSSVDNEARKIAYDKKRMASPPEHTTRLLQTDTKNGHAAACAQPIFSCSFLLRKYFSESICNVPSWRKPFPVLREQPLLFSRPKQSFRLPFT